MFVYFSFISLLQSLFNPVAWTCVKCFLNKHSHTQIVGLACTLYRYPGRPMTFTEEVCPFLYVQKHIRNISSCNLVFRRSTGSLKMSNQRF